MPSAVASVNGDRRPAGSHGVLLVGGRLDASTLPPPDTPVKAPLSRPAFAALDGARGRFNAPAATRRTRKLRRWTSDPALIRLGHSGSPAATRTQGEEPAERVPLVGSSHGRELATQAVEVEGAGAAGTWVLAPVTARGEAIGVLEATRGRLNDDATALCLDWHGGPAA